MTQTIKIITGNNQDEFAENVQEFLNDGFEIKSCNCGFINSEQYDFADYFQAILVKEEKLAAIAAERGEGGNT